MSRPLSRIAPDWWDYTTLDAEIIRDAAALWRRSGVLTDIEFYEFRYSGASSAFLRGLRAVTLGVVFNVLVMANVTLAAIKIGGVMLGLGPLESVVVAAGITLAYSAAGRADGGVVCAGPGRRLAGPLSRFRKHRLDVAMKRAAARQASLRERPVAGGAGGPIRLPFS